MNSLQADEAPLVNKDVVISLDERRTNPYRQRHNLGQATL